MTIYRKVCPAIWDDEKFIALGDDAQSIFLLLLTGPQTTSVPGIQLADVYTLASARRWAVDRVQAALDTLSDTHMVEVDPRLRVVRLPNAPKYNPPDNPSVLMGWWREFQRLPKSDLKVRHVASIKASIDFSRYPGTQGKDPLKSSFKAVWDATFGTLVDTVSDRVSNTVSHTVTHTLSTSVISDQGAVIREQKGKEVADDHASATAPAPLSLSLPKEKSKGKAEPMPYSVDALLGALAESGRFAVGKLGKGQTINAQQLIRSHPLETVRAASRWLRAGGDEWRGTLDGRHLKDLPAWVAQARKWEADGRPEIVKPAKSQTRDRPGWREPRPPVAVGGEVKL